MNRSDDALVVFSASSSSMQCTRRSPCLRAQVHGVVLESLRRMLALAPVGSSALTPLLLRHMPHKRMPKHMHVTYLQCAFALAESPEGAVLREPLLLGVVDLLLQVLQRASKKARLSPRDGDAPHLGCDFWRLRFVWVKVFCSSFVWFPIL